MRRRFVIVNDGREYVLVRAVVTYVAQGEGIRPLKEFFYLGWRWKSGNIAQLFKERAVARYNHSLERDGIFLLTKGRVEVFHRRFPLRVHTAFRFLKVKVQRRSLAVDVLIAVVLCGAFGLTTYAAQIAFPECLYSYYLIAYKFVPPYFKIFVFQMACRFAAVPYLTSSRQTYAL